MACSVAFQKNELPRRRVSQPKELIMKQRMKIVVEAVRNAFADAGARIGELAAGAGQGLKRTAEGVSGAKRATAIVITIGAAGYLIYCNLSLTTADRGEIGETS